MRVQSDQRAKSTQLNPQSKPQIQRSCQNNLGRSKTNETDTVSMHPTESREKSEQALLADAIVSAISYSAETLQIKAPNSHVFTDEFTKYPDWGAAVNHMPSPATLLKNLELFARWANNSSRVRNIGVPIENKNHLVTPSSLIVT